MVKRKASKSKGVHCMLHRQVLASKTLPNALQKVLDEMIQIVNFIKAGALNSRLFKKLCMDMGALGTTVSHSDQMALQTECYPTIF